MKKIKYMIVIVLTIAIAAGGYIYYKTERPAAPAQEIELPKFMNEDTELSVDSDEDKISMENETSEFTYIAADGMTLETRILSPQGYERVKAEAGSFAEFLRNYAVKEDGSPVVLYNGENKFGFLAEYTKWRDGQRISIDGNQVSWMQSTDYDDSYEAFTKFMRIIFSYAGTLSMEQGEKAFLLAQGYMPAQEFHVLKNPTHENDPWYYEREITYPFQTPEYSFSEGSLKRLSY